MTDPTRRGRCLCGAVTYEYEGPVNWSCHCHCESCRRNTGAAFSSFFGVPSEACRFTGETPQVYESSPGVRRHFCGRCGTPIAYEADKFPGEIHFYAGSLEDPSAFAPQFHVHHAERVPWAELADDLPRHAHGAEGSLADGAKT